ncbi:hypothetical protein PTTG_07470 [Puccinia triticina 1-1 BBBD Race 1]|uniref:Nuclear protein Es2 n=2 Tax=Puccinia triticina TaxID=208348 RepID=A0A180G2A3_PUCT1|nr:uncharacterized protein PtA15_3A213 [Puccinia triticina]OAV86836.1 hypothetical protein PTTG_07470 [Puccinia triticina 1-1 BBBD Race 1]WAQ82848.1 hypothetical protein PtA15_3A213 [Puccinia triticina]
MSTSPSAPRVPSKRELIQLKPAATPIRLEGDTARGLQPATYHPIHGILQQAPTISLKNQKVLEEDEYMEALSKIIKRDFFPSLDQFERQKQEAIEQRRRRNINNLLHSPSASSVRSSFTNSHLNNLNWSADSHPLPPSKGWEDGGPTPKITQTGTPGRTPLRAPETPIPTPAPTQLVDPIGSEQPAARKSCDDSLSLDEFCSRYTSEDNSSFSEILNNANRLKRIKYAWAFDSSSKHNSRLLESTLKREHLIGMIGKMAEGGHGVGLIEGISGKPGERKMIENVVTTEERLAIQAGEDPMKLITDGQPPQTKASGTTTTTTASSTGKSATAIDLVTDRHSQPIKNPDSWPHVTRNALMFSPDANISSHQPPKPPPFPVKPSVIPGDPKSINHASTRMTNDDFLEAKLRKSRASTSSRHSLSSLSPTRSQIAAAINGTPNTANGSPKVNGFSFVPELPTPDPDQMKTSTELDQLMTWGEIMTTPVRLGDGEDSSGRGMADDDEEEEDEEKMVEAGPFRISKRARREELAIGMARQASKSLRQKYGYSAGLGTGRSGPSKLRRSLLADRQASSPSHHPHSSPNSPHRNSNVAHSPRRDQILSPAAKLLLKKTGGSAASSHPSSPLAAGHHHKLGQASGPAVAKKAGIFTPLVARKP